MKKSFKFKNITTSMLAIMLCVAMIFSFSLSVYAADGQTVFMATGDGYQNCWAFASILENSSRSYTAKTELVSGHDKLYYMDVFLIVDDGSEIGGISGFDYIYVNDLDDIRDVEVDIQCSYPAELASAGHTITDIYGLSCTEGTFIEH